MTQDGNAGTTPDTQATDNMSFLRALFGTDWGEAHVTGFAGDPRTGGGWGGGRAIDQHWNPDHNNYYAVSLFNEKARRKEVFRELRVLAIDDVGPALDPVEVNALFGRPTYRIETSPGNEQWGYRLAWAIRDFAVADALLGACLKALVGTGPDPGMAGVTRYMRLPVGMNWKAKLGPAGFRVRLMYMAQDNRDDLSPTNLLPFFKIEVSAEVVKFPVARASGPPGLLDDALAEHDITFQAMRRLDLVIGGPRTTHGMGRIYDVICPWSAEHTDRATSGSAYAPILQRFQCHHGHCAHRTAEDLGSRLDALLRADSGGLCGLADLEWPDDLPPELVTGPPSGTADVSGGAASKSPADRFFERWVYLRPQDRMFDLDTCVPVKDRDVDSAWSLILRDELPARGTGSGVQRLRPVTPTSWFLVHRRGRRVDGLVFWPGEGRVLEHDGRWLANIWKETPRPLRDAPAHEVDAHAVSPWLELFWHVLGDMTLEQREIGEAVLDWLALVVGSHVKGGWQVVIIGGQGIGKDLILTPLMRALGNNRAQVLSASEISADFNEWAAKRLVQAAEMRQTTRGASTPHDQMARLKSVFDPGKQWLPINPKFGIKHSARNTVMAWITSNEDVPLRLDEDDRRFLVLDRRDEVTRWDGARFTKLVAWMDAGGDARVAEYLCRRWTRMDAAARQRLMGIAPMTDDKASLIEQERDPVDVFLRECMDARPPHPDAFSDVVSVAYVRDRVIQAQKNGRLLGARPNLHPVSIAKRLRRLGAQQPAIKQVEAGGVWHRLWIVRNCGRHVGAPQSVLKQFVESNLT